MSRIESDASPFTTPHRPNAHQSDDEEGDDCNKGRKDKEEPPRRPILSASASNSTSTSKKSSSSTTTTEEKLMKTLQPSDSSEEEQEDDDEDDDDDDDVEEGELDMARSDIGLAPTAAQSKPSIVQTNIRIDKVEGDLVLGTQIKQTKNVVTTAAGEDGGKSRLKRQKSDLTEEEKEHVFECAKSTRVLEEMDLKCVSRRIGKDWRHVGNGLKINHAQLDQIEEEFKSTQERVYSMLFQWLSWKDDKATVKKLTKALWNHQEYDAIQVLKP